jgi:hypothetical protein
MSAITKALTFEQRYADPSANPLNMTEEEIREAYRVICSAWRVDDSPSTVKDLEDELITDFIAPVGAIGVMVARPKATRWGD